MTLFTINFQSEKLHKQTEVNVFLPQNANRASHLKTIWLLHGMTDDHTGWLRKSEIELYAEKYGICAVMPNADLSFYVNMAYGADYFEYISTELPAFLKRFLPISDSKDDNYLAGVSMGGYGAFLTAMNCPDKYCAAVSLSGPMCISWINSVLSNEELAISQENPDGKLVKECENIFSDRNGIPRKLVECLMESGNRTTARIFKGMFGLDPCLTGNQYDIFNLAKQLADGKKELKLLACCGEEDYHYKSNIDFAETAGNIGLDYSLETGSGEHNWQYWNSKIPKIMEILFA